MDDRIAVLRAVRDLLSNPDAWTREKLARDAWGASVRPKDPRAQCWCLMGAVSKVTQWTDPEAHPAYSDLATTLQHVGKACGCNVEGCSAMLDTVPDFNDDPDTTHPDVLALLDTTIERLTHE